MNGDVSLGDVFGEVEGVAGDGFAVALVFQSVVVVGEFEHGCDEGEVAEG